MKIRFYLVTLLIIFACLISQDSHSCTTFCVDKDDQLVVGFNFDWFVGDALVYINKKNVSKTALLIKELKNENHKPHSWTSKFGNVSIGWHEFPIGGLNEVGLVVWSSGLMKTTYPLPDTRSVISQLQWIQYHLDNSGTVDEVLASNKYLRIPNPDSAKAIKVHYFVCDSKGNCAVIEFIDGKMVHYTQETMPEKALTNITYRESLEFFKEDKLPTPNPGHSAERFAAVADMAKKYNVKTSKPAVDYAFDMLAKVSAGTVEEIDGVRVRSPLSTVWSVVLDLKNLRIYLRAFENPKIRYFNINSFDFSCRTPVKVLDIQAEFSGDVTSKFIDYSYKLNRELIKKSNIIGLSNEQVDIRAKFPETVICTDK